MIAHQGPRIYDAAKQYHAEPRRTRGKCRSSGLSLRVSAPPRDFFPSSPIRRPLALLALVLLLMAGGCRGVDCGKPPMLAPDELPAPKMIPYLTCQAEENDAQTAQLYLGVIYDEGNLGVPQNYAEAAKWYERAARDRPGGPTGVYMPPIGKQSYGTWLPLTPTPGAKGIAHAQYRLGIFYRDGLGVPRDVTKAKHWLKKAAAQGHRPAIEALEQLA